LNARLSNSQSAVKPARGGLKRSIQRMGVRESEPASKRIAHKAGAISGQSEEGLQAPGSGETPGPTVQSGWEKVRTETGLGVGVRSPRQVDNIQLPLS
jgi:hypothetical protein